MTVEVSKKEYGRSVAGVNLAVFFWGITPVFVKASDATSSALLAYRLLLTTPVAFWFFFREGSRINRKIMTVAIMPALFFYISTGSGYAAFQQTSIANAMLISQLAPVIVLFAAPIMFKERLDPRRVMLAISALGGAVLVVLGGGKTDNATLVGDLWAVSNCITWAIYFLMVKRQRDLGAKLWGFLAPVMFWTTIFAFIGPVFLKQSLAVTTVFDWLMVMSVGFLSMTAHALLTWAQRNMEATYTSLLMLSMPIISAIAAYVVFREKLSALQFLGGLIVVTSLALVTLVSSRLNRSIASVPDPA